jgi:hypothetical protein
MKTWPDHVLASAWTGGTPVVETTDGGIIWDTTAIILHLEDRYPEHAVLPKDDTPRFLCFAIGTPGKPVDNKATRNKLTWNNSSLRFATMRTGETGDAGKIRRDYHRYRSGWAIDGAAHDARGPKDGDYRA